MLGLGFSNNVMATPATSFPCYVFGNSRIRDISSMTTYGTARVFVMELSPTGSLLATGDEDGVLEVSTHTRRMI